VEVISDKVSAEYKNGVLTVTLPKPAVEAARTRRIEVKNS
jgi:HSP20 family molecular chaperone IbpA